MEDLVAARRRAGERVGRRRGVAVAGRGRAGGPRGVGVDAQHLAEQRGGVLRLGRRVSAIAGRRVEEPVGAEGNLAAVVVGGRRVRDDQHLATGQRIGDAAIGRDPEFVDPVALAVGCRVVDVKAPAGGVVGREGHRQQALLSRALDAPDRGGHVEEQTAGFPFAPHADRTALFDDHQPRVVPRRSRQVDRLGKRAERVQLCRVSRAGNEHKREQREHDER